MNHKSLITGQHKFIFNIAEYNFEGILRKIFDNWEHPIYELYKYFDDSDKLEQIIIDGDTKTKFHRKYYDSPYYNEFLEEYYRFVKEVVLPLFNDENEFVIQKDPAFRIHLPNNTALGYRPNMNDPEDKIGLHCDGDYGHPIGEINFMLTLSGQYGNNSCFVETEPENNNFTPLEMEYGEFISFNGNKCRHYNKTNDTGVGRVSIDFRIIPKALYDETYRGESLHGKRKFIIGGYYIAMTK